MGKKQPGRRDAFLRHMTSLLGEVEAQELVSSLDGPASKSVRYNRCFFQDSSIPIPESKPVPWCSPRGRYWEREDLPSRTLEYAAGHYYIQEASAMLAIGAASRVVDFNGKRVIDLTAAPGGKTTQAAELLGNGYMVANEVVRKRVDALLWNVNRYRLENVIITSLPTDKLAAGLTAFFDIVIVDAPCSGEGLFQRGKHSQADWSSKNVRYCARRQQRILKDAVNLVRPGGYLIYSTCTFSREENEDQVEGLLNSGLEPVPLPGGDELPVSPAITSNEAVASCCRRIFPHREPGAGAFLSVLQRPQALTYQGIDGTDEPPFQEAIHGKISLPEALKPATCSDYFYEQNGVVCLFNQSRIPSVLRDNAIQLGAPLYDKRRDNALMYGSTQRPSKERLIPLEHGQANAYIRGENLSLSQPGGWYFAAVDGMVLGPVLQSGTTTENHFPKPLRLRE